MEAKKTALRRRYRGAILDADNTLFDFDRAERSALRDVLQAGGFPEPPPELFDRYHAINDQLWKRFEAGDISQEDLRTERFRLLLPALPTPRGESTARTAAPEPRIIAEQYIERLGRKGYLLPHAGKVLRTLAARLPLVLLSNGIAAVQRQRIASAGIGRHFRAILISGELGVAKPDPEIFAAALSSLGLPAGSVLCVGDSPRSDIRGAHEAGLDTCWVARPGAEYPTEEPAPDYTIRDLRELLALFPIGDR